jgi:hypothetical protein
VPQAPLLGGLFIGVLSALPIVSLGNCCCLWIVGGGVLAAYLDQQNDPRPTTLGRGAYNGLLAGVFGAVVWLVVAVALEAVLGPLRERVLGDIVRVAQDMPPEARAILESLRGSSPVGFAFDFLVLLCVGAIFSTAGGMLGASFFRTDVPPALGGPVEPPPDEPQ